MLFLTLLTLFQSFKQYSYNKQFINYFNGYYLPLHFYYILIGNPGALQQFQRAIGWSCVNPLFDFHPAKYETVYSKYLGVLPAQICILSSCVEVVLIRILLRYCPACDPIIGSYLLENINYCGWRYMQHYVIYRQT